MLIRLKKPSHVASHEITPETVYLNRRGFIEAAGLGVGTLLLPAKNAAWAAVMPADRNAKFADVKAGYRKLGPKDVPTPYDAATTYNNFYEFGIDKSDPAERSGKFKPMPWSVKVDGLCAKPGTLDLDDFIKPHTLEERIYRMRCVEAWSMVIPWVGFSLADVVKRFEPQGSAKFVAFESVVRPSEMRGQNSTYNDAGLDYPYVEGLRLDEATNPLAMLAVGIYGKPLPNQNGAPLRLVTPWKYGFKGIKSIVRISFTEKQPANTWNLINSQEYGFYSNVNPKVDHPRWTQATERRIGDFLRRETLMFNGYQEEVGQLYAGMDLQKNF